MRINLQRIILFSSKKVHELEVKERKDDSITEHLNALERGYEFCQPANIYVDYLGRRVTSVVAVQFPS